MMRRYLVFVGLAVVSGLPLLAQVQSLADVARAEEARRKAVKQAREGVHERRFEAVELNRRGPLVRLNLPLRPAQRRLEVRPSRPAASTPDPSAKDEKYWRGRITAARTALDHDKVLVDAVQSRINALNTDFVNTSDPAQRALVDSNRNVALAELDRLNKDIQAQTKAVSDIQEEARKASVPSGWLR